MKILSILFFMPFIATAFPNLREQNIIIIGTTQQQCQEEGLCYFIGDEGNGVCGDCE